MPFASDWLSQLDLRQGFETLKPAAMFALAVAVYGVLVFNFYRIMSRRVVFVAAFSQLRSSEKLRRRVSYYLIYAARYLLVFPILVYVWFWLLVMMVALLYSSKEPDELLLIAMAVLTAIRVTSYYNESLSADIAKILPYGLLGIFLVSFGNFDLDAYVGLLSSIRSESHSAFYYWVFIVAQELVLRVTEPPLKAGFEHAKRLADRFRNAGQTIDDPDKTE